MKRFSMVLVIILTILLSGCTTNPQQPFTEYLDELMIEVIDEKDIGINLSFVDAQKFGINPDLYELGFNTPKDYQESHELYKDIIKQLKSYKNLSGQEAVDRDVLVSYFESYLDDVKYYDFLEGGNLNYSRSMMTNLPTYLEVYQFRSEADIKAYFHFIETLPTFFQKYLDLELDRQNRGLGYGQEIIDRIVNVLNDTISMSQTDEYFLLNNFDEKLEKLDFEVDKEALSNRHASLLKNEYTEAHVLLSEGLKKIEADFSKGLARYKNGKDFYEHQLKKNTGLDMSVKEIQKMLKQEFQSLVFQIGNYSESDFDLLFEDDFYPDFDSGEHLLEFLSREMQNDFPKISNINYEVKQVDESMSEASSPAYYFTPHLDSGSKEKQYIFINGPHTPQLYSTYAHEGFPGHMYQFNYFLNLKMHPIRNLLTVGANAEGWANYAEMYALKYIVDDSVVELSKINNRLNQIVTSLIDIGIHYEGWLLPDMVDYLIELGFANQTAALEDFEDMYIYMVANPAVYPMYYVSSIKIDHLRDEFEGSDYEFHEAFLNMGSSRFDVIEKYIKK